MGLSSGNILWRDETVAGVDFDDARQRPGSAGSVDAAQRGYGFARRYRLDILLDAYQEFVTSIRGSWH